MLSHKNKTMQRLLVTALFVSPLLLGGCASQIEKLGRVGEVPPVSRIENPVAQPGYKPLSWPLPETPEHNYQANSLWQPGARAFFRDQRASRVGDLLRVKVSINEQAELDNASTDTTAGGESIAAPKFFGLEKLARRTPLVTPDINNLASVTSSSNASGTGTIKRQEKITTMIAAQVTQILPNGNMVLDGRQEIRVNSELRELSVKGVIRREDIGSDNTIDSSQIAEARITYGGRGRISDVQQPRWGQQVIDAISPF